MLEKNVSANDIFRLQDSQSAEIFSQRLAEFGRKCPHTMQYLKAIRSRREMGALRTGQLPYNLLHIPCKSDYKFGN